MRQAIDLRFDEGEGVFTVDGREQAPERTRPLRVLVCGGRDFSDYKAVRAVLCALNISVVIHGAARGADTLAARAAEHLGVGQIACPADWRQHGRRAGFIRNREMLEHKPDVVIAFPGGRGTADMVNKASSAGVTVYEIRV